MLVYRYDADITIFMIINLLVTAITTPTIDYKNEKTKMIDMIKIIMTMEKT